MRQKNRVRMILMMPLFMMFALNSNAQHERFYAAFTYQFTKLINWPDRSGDFVIGVLGASSVVPSLQQMAKEKKVGTSSIIIKEWKDIESIGNCNILFVPDNQKGNLSVIKAKLSNKRVLIITESPGMITNGSCINFVKVGNKIQFELNKTIIEKMGLQISSALETYALKVA
jgi:hypothetical protein